MHDDVVQELSRRGFLRAAAISSVAIGAAGALPPSTAHAADRREGHGHDRDQIPPGRISIQLYTLRDQLQIDLDGTLAALHDIGYTRVEHAGFVGRTVDEFKAALDAHDLWASSGHVGIPQPFDPAAWSDRLDEARTLGSKYIVHPFFGINFGTGEVVRDSVVWTAFAHDLNRAGEMARRAGLRLGYHNHNWEFFSLLDDPSRNAYDVLTRETDRDVVHLEIDIFWAWRGAADPVDLINANRGRVLQFHVKDLNQAGSFEDPGQGLIDFARVFDLARKGGVVEYIVERDDAGTAPRAPEDALDTARVGYEFLRTVRF
jgi:sugar phosphate isomerase/epimerase